jgi:hypothetical protein
MPGTSQTNPAVDSSDTRWLLLALLLLRIDEMIGWKLSIAEIQLRHCSAMASAVTVRTAIGRRW